MLARNNNQTPYDSDLGTHGMNNILQFQNGEYNS